MITPEMKAKLRRSLINHERLRHFPYVDTVGKITIGIGYNLTDRGMDDAWINAQYEKDVAFFYNKLNEAYPWFKNLNLDRQIVLIDMAFMGFKKFSTFKKMLNALEAGDYKRAYEEMLDSKWAEQVKSRAKVLANAMRLGVYDI